VAYFLHKKNAIKTYDMKNIFLIAALSVFTFTACNDNDDSTGNGAYMQATDNEPGNTTSDNSHKNNVNSAAQINQDSLKTK
jgi:hypothetical protein